MTVVYTIDITRLLHFPLGSILFWDNFCTLFVLYLIKIELYPIVWPLRIIHYVNTAQRPRTVRM